MKTYEDDLESTKENMWSKLNELADVATMVYEEEQRKKKGKSKIVYEEEEEEEDDERFRFLDYVPRKIRSSLRYSQQQRNYENLNGASTSSSSSSLRHLRCSETRTCLHYNTPDIESPQNPNSQSSSSQTESTSRKRLALVLQPRNSSGKFKKAKVVASLPRIARGPPEWLGEVMREMGVTEDPMLIFDFEKPLSASDVNSELSRFLLPFSMLTRNDFLTPAESAAILREDIDEGNIGVGTLLVNKNSEMWGLRLKLWAMEKKESGNGTLNYALNWGWNDVVKGNKLKAGHEISLWSFRFRGVLCFALEHRIPSLSKRLM
ncbi:PREDICTED: putative B3 domain-containing protein At5g35780 [Camelina sativa]|uniref:B3 domain-containing protein At5g35780 n=1 Tax=Camelina sativa TaxID=90675 RepID=A0ABM0U5Z8_CAMSA|nr:PREDICTED: putative B3 domain-containing protein At5g35780 [Camelina sativa]